MEYDKTVYTLNPIGMIYEKDDLNIIEINEKYKKCLKYVSMFSHVTIFYEDCKNNNITNTNLSQKVIKFDTSDEIKGIFTIKKTITTKNKILLYDIKPYFPDEDRVQHARVSFQGNIFHNTNKRRNQNLTQLGMVHKEEGNYYLEFKKDIDTSFLKECTHLKIIWWFHKFDTIKYRQILQCSPPYEHAPKSGVFATRSPVRPNPIAMTIAKVIKINEIDKRIYVSKLDCFDKTPFIGISPYIPKDDLIDDYRLPKWLEHWSKWVDDSQFFETKDIQVKDSSIVVLRTYTRYTLQQTTHMKLLMDEDNRATNATNEIRVKGARQHNLKNIDVNIPHNKITVITGVSGSGKSSLAFDTIYAESQQRFFSNMSFSLRSHISSLEKPLFDQITGLPPTIAITQQYMNRNPRSTVGTLTNLYDLLRSLFANIGQRHCPTCGNAITKMTTEEIIDQLAQCKPHTQFRIKPFQVEDQCDTIVVPNDITNEKFLTELRTIVASALSIGLGAIQVVIDDLDTILLQTTQKCYECDKIFFELTPSCFSFNNTQSMCPICNGLGYCIDVAVNRIISDSTKSILDGASLFWGNLRSFIKSPNANWMKGQVIALAKDMHIDLELAWNDLPDDFKHKVIYGCEEEVLYTYENNNGRSGSIKRSIEGAYPILKRLSKVANTGTKENEIRSFMTNKECSCCHGERLNKEFRMVTLADMRFSQVGNMPFEELNVWLLSLSQHLSKLEYERAYPILQELYVKITDYIAIGLGYLTLDRSSPTLSGGEQQRLQLVSQLSSGITNILYILDEPTNGLHPKDYEHLIDVIYKLKATGNTIVIVEHNPTMMLIADHIIDIGGGAGKAGGYVIAQGSIEKVMKKKDSETALYLSGTKKLAFHKETSLSKNTSWIDIKGINSNNLHEVDVRMPLNAFICISGVSGSGKSSLMKHGIYPALLSITQQNKNTHKMYHEIIGGEHIQKVIYITQAPIGRSSRSTPATYTGIMDEIRLLFSKSTNAKEKNYTASKFSYNSKDGQCSTCHGYGYTTLNTPFLPFTKVICPTCHGKKYNATALEISYQERNIAEVLAMSIIDASLIFKDNKKIAPILQVFIDVGLGYLTLGQDATTLSGGEAQRVKLAYELSNYHATNTVYLLDEPTSGLAFSDIQNLLDIFGKLVDHGNTIIIIEHNLSVMKHADWIIDLGPEGGVNGGYVIFQGSPEDSKSCAYSHTGNLLKKHVF